MEKKHKSQKAKHKTSESRKQLSSVRVIQRNLVYIVGLPLNLADEDVSIFLVLFVFDIQLDVNWCITVPYIWAASST